MKPAHTPNTIKSKQHRDDDEHGTSMGMTNGRGNNNEKTKNKPLSVFKEAVTHPTSGKWYYTTP